MSARRTASGFTLVETLVAVTLLALLFGALMPVFQQGLTVLRVADRHARALLLAQSLLERDAASVPTGEEPRGESDGTEGEMQWQVVHEAYAGDDAGPVISGESRFALVKVTATVTWPGNASGVRLSTLGIVEQQ